MDSLLLIGIAVLVCFIGALWVLRGGTTGINNNAIGSGPVKIGHKKGLS